jgi:hypothetical protein
MIKASEKVEFPPNIDNLKTESDVEQFFLLPLITSQGLGYKVANLATKQNIRMLPINKGGSKKNYYPDYIIDLETIPFFIIEAKNPDESLDEASHEGRLYATEINALYPNGVNPCKYVVTSNGRITEVFHWDSDQLLLRILTSEFKMTSQKYTNFIDLLGYQTAINHITKLKPKILSTSGRRPISLIGGDVAQSDRIDPNQFGQILVTHYEQLFNPTAQFDRKRVVENAYVNSKKKERYFDEIDKVVAKSAVFKSIPATEISNTEEPLELISQFEDPQSLSNQIMLLVGARGTGKTTFVDYLQFVKLKKSTRNDLVWIRIDFNNAPSDNSELNNWVRRNIITELESFESSLRTPSLKLLTNLFKEEINRRLTFISELHGEESLQYKSALETLLSEQLKDDNALIRAYEKYVCSGLGKLLIIACDNCDKRESELQLNTFDTIRWIKSEIRCLVLLPIRDITYQTYADQPPLDTAIKSLTFLVTPPPFQKILMRRITFLIKDAQTNPPKNMSYYTENGSKVIFDSNKINTFLRAINEAFFSEKTRLGKRILQGISGKNVRKGIEMFLAICKSGYLPESDIFGISAGGSENPFNEALIYDLFLRTDRRYYSGDNSYIINVYGALDTKPRIDHFLRYNILNWLFERREDTGPTRVRGFHPFSDMRAEMELIGYDLESIENEFNYLVIKELIFAEPVVTENSEILICLSSSGAEHLNLAKSMNYLSACAEDSFIADLKVCNDIANRLKNQPSRGRVVLNAIDFGDYLFEELNALDKRVSSSKFERSIYNFTQSLEQAKKFNKSYRERFNGKSTPPYKATSKNCSIQNVRDARSKKQ